MCSALCLGIILLLISSEAVFLYFLYDRKYQRAPVGHRLQGLKTITKHGFVIGEFCSNRSNVAWPQVMLFGLRKAKRVNDSTNIE